MSRCRALLLALVGLAAVSPVQAQSESRVLLLGLRRTLPAVKAPYGEQLPQGLRTLRIEVAGERATFRERPEIWVRRDSGLWHVGMTSQRSGEWFEEQLVAAPQGQPLKAAPMRANGIEDEDELKTEGFLDLDLLFVGPNHASAFLTMAGYTQHAAHPFMGRGISVASLNALAKPLPIQAVCGPAANAAFQKAAAAYLASHPDEREVLEPQAADTQWGLIRRGGHWVVRGFLSYAYEVVRDRYALFDVPVTPPQSLTGYDGLPLSWASLRQLDAGAVDAFASPDGQFLGVMGHHQLTLYRRQGKTGLGKPLQRIPLNPNEAAVAIQWTTPSAVPAWR